MREEYLSKIVKTVSRIANLDEDQVRQRTSTNLLSSFDVDSMILVEIVAVLEEEFDVFVSEDDFSTLNSIDSFVDFVERKKAEKQSKAE